MLYRAGLVLSLSVLAITGCSRFSISNNSLDYKKTKVLAPLQLPNDSTRPMTAIYPAPVIDPVALENAPNFINKQGNRFEMPAPKALTVMNNSSPSIGIGAPTQPVIVTDGNGFPLMKIEGDTNRVWDLMSAALSVSNIKVIDRNQTAGWVSIRLDKQTVYLRLNRSGSMTTITVQDDKNALIDKDAASDVLVQLNQNWPA